MAIPFINLQAQYQAYKQEIDKAIQSILDTSSYIMGRPLLDFEADLARFVGVKHAIGCASGTDALLLAMMALDIQPGDEVITTPYTFIATAEMIAFLKAKPVFVDIEPDTFNIDTRLIETAISKKTRAIMPVALFGQCADMTAIRAITEPRGIPVIEDAAQSLGATYHGTQSGALADIGCTSFFPAKPLGCYGDGGAIFTDNDALAEKMRVLLNHGQTRRYVHSHVGINGRLDALQAAVLQVKLKHFPEEIEKRNTIANRYSNELQHCSTPQVHAHNQSVWAQYCVRVKNRDTVIDACQKAGVPTAIYYPIPLHLQQVFAYLGHAPGDFPVSEQMATDILALPMSAFLSEVEQSLVIDTINTATA